MKYAEKKDALKRFLPLAESIASLLYPHAEVVVHDIETNKIAAIYNGFSRREVGDASDIEKSASIDSGPDQHGPFIKDGFYGNRIKYSSTVLRSDQNELVGLMCINLNIEGLLQLQNSIASFLSIDSDSSQLDQLFNDNWQDRIGSFVDHFLRSKNRTGASLLKDERVELVDALRKAGAFKAKNAATFTANRLGVSRATIYNYLSELEREDSKGGKDK